MPPTPSAPEAVVPKSPPSGGSHPTGTADGRGSPRTLAIDERFRELLEAAPDAMVVAGADGVIRLVNRRLLELFGYEPDELEGRARIEILVPERYRQIHVDQRKGYFHAPRTRPMGTGLELYGRRRDGTEFPVDISLSPMQTDLGTLSIAAVRDISDRKLVETRLRSSLEEKEVLLKEVHHRVKNNLQIVSSMLNLQIGQLSDPEAIRLLKESLSRVRSIGLLHEQLYQANDVARVDIGGYLRELAGGLFAAYGVSPDEIVLSVQTEDVTLGLDAAMSCGLIVNELVSNSLKHAFPGGRRGHVAVSLRREGQTVVLEVSDDGVGLPAELDPRDPPTLGLELVGILSEQLGGVIDVDRRAGTSIGIRFPEGTAT